MKLCVNVKSKSDRDFLESTITFTQEIGTKNINNSVSLDKLIRSVIQEYRLLCVKTTMTTLRAALSREWRIGTTEAAEQ